jgi:hypothetical protein
MTMCNVTKQVVAAPPAPTAPLVPEHSPPELLGPKLSPPNHPMPESLLPRYSPIPSLPPAKRTRRAVKRQCEAELLRSEEGEDTLLSTTRIADATDASATIASGTRPIYANSSHPGVPLRPLLRQRTSSYSRRSLSLRLRRLRLQTRTQSRCSSW